MSFKKIIAGLSLPLFLSSLLFSQSLVELAKKEKERREKLKDKKKIVVTNDDLRNIDKRPAITTTRPAFFPEESERQENLLDKSSLDKAEPSKARALPSEAETRPSEAGRADRSEPREATPEELEANWKKSREYVNLLTTKMNGLWQEFYSMDDMSSRDDIQREISETSLRLQKAKEDEAKARREFQRSRTRARK